MDVAVGLNDNRHLRTILSSCSEFNASGPRDEALSEPRTATSLTTSLAWARIQGSGYGVYYRGLRD